MSLDEARVVKILYDAEGEAASLQFGSSLRFRWSAWSEENEKPLEPLEPWRCGSEVAQVQVSTRI